MRYFLFITAVLCFFFTSNLYGQDTVSSLTLQEVPNAAIAISDSSSDINLPPLIINTSKQIGNDPYLLDYTFMGGTPNWKRVGNNTIFVGGFAVTAMVILYFAPESFTNWKRDELRPNKVFGKWERNVTGGLVIDHDDLFLNWVTHPYCGAIYYMTARSAGFNGLWSFTYSFAMSTFFWEMGIEALAEKPSLQDVIITPCVGSVLGEAFYIAKRAIVANDYKVGYKFVGHFLTFLMDPLNEIMDAIQGTWHQKNYKISLVGFASPYISPSGKNGLSFNIQLNF